MHILNDQRNEMSVLARWLAQATLQTTTAIEFATAQAQHILLQRSLDAGVIERTRAFETWQQAKSAYEQAYHRALRPFDAHTRYQRLY